MTLDLASLAPTCGGAIRGEVSYPALDSGGCLAVEERSFWFRHRNRCIVSLGCRFPPDHVFLDIGGGNGFVPKALAAAGFACALVEPGVDGALAAHARGLDPVICARLEDLKLSAASVSAAGLFDVLEPRRDAAEHTLERSGFRVEFASYIFALRGAPRRG
jgi:hypothetical protein